METSGKLATAVVPMLMTSTARPGQASSSIARRKEDIERLRGCGYPFAADSPIRKMRAVPAGLGIRKLVSSA